MLREYVIYRLLVTVKLVNENQDDRNIVCPQSPQAGGLDQLASLGINSPMSDVVTQSVLSPIRTTGLQHNSQSPMSRWMVDINEGTELWKETQMFMLS